MSARRWIPVVLAVLVLGAVVAWLLRGGGEPVPVDPAPPPPAARTAGTDNVLKDTPATAAARETPPPAPAPDTEPPVTPSPPETFVLEGRVFRQDGSTPAFPAGVTVRLPDSLTTLRADTDENGAFRVEGLEKGTHDVTASATDPAWGGPLRVAIDIPAEETRLVLTSGGIVEVFLVDAVTGETVVPRHVEMEFVYGERSTSIGTWSRGPSASKPDPQRPFTTFPLIVGETRILRVKADGYETTDSPTVELSRGEAKRELRIPLRRDPRGEGTVVMRLLVDSGSLPDHVNVIRYENGGWSGHGIPVKDGKLRMVLPAGHHVLTVGGYPEGSNGIVAREDLLPVEVEVDVVGEGEIPVPVILRRGGHIRLTGPAEGFENGLITLEGGGASWKVMFAERAGGEGKPTTWTSCAVPPGTWRATIRVSGKERTLTATVVAGETTNVKLDP